MRVVAFGTYDARRHPRVAVLLAGLRAHGVTVEECNVPLDVDTAARVETLRRPWRLVPLAGKLIAAWVRLWRRARRVEPPDAVLVGYLGVLDVHLARRCWPQATLVLDHLASVGGIARDRALGRPAMRRLLDRIDVAGMRRADIVVVDTGEHLALMPAALQPRGVVVPVGAPDAWFGTAGDAVHDGAMRVVFFGLYTPLQGAPTVGEAIARCGPAVAFTMIGHGQDLAATRAAAGGRAGVEWREWVAPELLPRLVAGHDVCLGIFGTGEKAQLVVPNKVYQGAAAGCAIVTSDTGPQRTVLEDAAVFVPPGDPAALAQALERLAADRAILAEMRRRSRVHADRAFRPAAVVTALVGALARLRH